MTQAKKVQHLLHFCKLLTPESILWAKQVSGSGNSSGTSRLTAIASAAIATVISTLKLKSLSEASQDAKGRDCCFLSSTGKDTCSRSERVSSKGWHGQVSSSVAMLATFIMIPTPFLL